MGGIAHKWVKIKDCLKVIGFEPDQREFKKLQNSQSAQFLNYVVYKNSQDIELHITKDPGKSSIYKPNFKILDEFPDLQRHQIVDKVCFERQVVDCLDNILKQQDLKADFLKIDTQGSELDILKGAEDSLASIFGIELEVEFISLYENQPLFVDVHSFMTQKGFVLYDLRRAFWKRKKYFDYVGKGQLVFADALYVKEIDRFLIVLDKIKDEKERILKIYCSVMTCLVYGIYDYAFILTENVFKKEYISSDDYKKIIEAIKRISKANSLPYFWGREFLYKVFNKITELLKPKSYLGWADGDKIIGNVKSV